MKTITINVPDWMSEAQLERVAHAIGVDEALDLERAIRAGYGPKLDQYAPSQVATLTISRYEWAPRPSSLGDDVEMSIVAKLDAWSGQRGAPPAPGWSVGLSGMANTHGPPGEKRWMETAAWHEMIDAIASKCFHAAPEPQPAFAAILGTL